MPRAARSSFVHRDMKLTNELEVLDRRLEEHRTTSAALRAEQQQLAARREHLEQERTRLVERRDALAADAAKVREAEAALRRALQDVTGHLTQDAAARQRLARELAEVRSQHELLCEMRESFEGYQHGVKSVLRAAADEQNPLPGVYGTVADLLRVPEEFEVAVEAALGSRLQYIAVATGRDAQRAIAHLKETGEGRATFLPYDLLRPPVVDRALVRELFEEQRRARRAGERGGLVRRARPRAYRDVARRHDSRRGLRRRPARGRAETLPVPTGDARRRGLLGSRRDQRRPGRPARAGAALARIAHRAARGTGASARRRARRAQTAEQGRAREAASLETQLGEIAQKGRALDERGTEVAPISPG